MGIKKFNILPSSGQLSVGDINEEMGESRTKANSSLKTLHDGLGGWGSAPNYSAGNPAGMHEFHGAEYTGLVAVPDPVTDTYHIEGAYRTSPDITVTITNLIGDWLIDFDGSSYLTPTNYSPYPSLPNYGTLKVIDTTDSYNPIYLKYQAQVCVVGETELLMDGGSIKLAKDLIVGDQAKTYDHPAMINKSGRDWFGCTANNLDHFSQVITTITNVESRFTDTLVTINNKFRASQSHVIFVFADKLWRWAEVGSLKAGWLIVVDGVATPIRSLAKESGKFLVYRISCHPYHGFIGDGIFMHNAKTLGTYRRYAVRVSNNGTYVDPRFDLYFDS